MKILWIFVFGVILFFACNKSSVAPKESRSLQGSISLKFKKAQIPSNVDKIEGVLEKNNTDNIVFICDVDGDNISALVDNISPGLWKLTVNAYNKQGILIYTGSSDVNILAGQLTQITIQLNAVNGSLEITVLWPSEVKLDSLLLAYFPFNGNADDESGNGLNGSVNGAVLAMNRFENSNSAYAFDGVNDYINLGNNFNFNFSTPFSICAWIKTAGATSLQTIFCKAENSPNSTYHYNLSVHFQYPRALLRETVGNDINVMSSLFVSDNVWHFIVMTYDGSGTGDGLRLIVDGAVNSTGTLRGEPSDMSNSDAALIGSQRGDINFFNGTLDDIRVYNRVLTQSEIITLYYWTE